jgi:hypothetical protein
MLGALDTLIQAILEMASFVAAGAIEVLNLLFAALTLAGEAAQALLPGLPNVATIAGEILGGFAWFYPIGQIVAFFATIITMFLVWLGVRYLLRLVRAA